MATDGTEVRVLKIEGAIAQIRRKPDVLFGGNGLGLRHYDTSGEQKDSMRLDDAYTPIRIVFPALYATINGFDGFDPSLFQDDLGFAVGGHIDTG